MVREMTACLARGGVVTRRGRSTGCQTSGHDNAKSEQEYSTTARFGDLADDLTYSTTARFNVVTPNLCDDMHDSCAPTNDPIKQGDGWLQSNLPPILGSSAYLQNGLVLILWDEGTNASDGPIGLIALSPLAKGNGYSNAIRYTHSSTLRSLEEIFGVGPFLGDAANATDLSDLFR
jgi:phosphatidylinositol-3-phosphatase